MSRVRTIRARRGCFARARPNGVGSISGTNTNSLPFLHHANRDAYAVLLLHANSDVYANA